MNLRVVSQQSREEVAASRALEQTTDRLRALAANMLRVMAGAGKPEQVADQLHECLVAMVAFQESALNPVPAEAIVHALNYEEAWHDHRPWIRENRNPADEARWRANGELDFQDALNKMAKAGMRMAASKLVDQNTQLRAAETQMCEGHRALDAARERLRRTNGM